MTEPGKYIDPRKEPNKWLIAVLNRCVDDGDEASKEALKESHRLLISWLEPSIVDSLFDHWITPYCSLLDERESNRSSSDQQCSPEDQPG